MVVFCKEQKTNFLNLHSSKIEEGFKTTEKQKRRHRVCVFIMKANMKLMIDFYPKDKNLPKLFILHSSFFTLHYQF